MTNCKLDRRSLFRFSLRFLFVCLTVLCIAIGLYARRVERQRRAVRAILQAGGRVTYEHKFLIGWRSHGRKEVAVPKWALDAIGDDWFYPVTGVTLYRDGCNDAVLKNVENLPSVKSLALWAWAAPPESGPMGGSVIEGPLAGVTDDGLQTLSLLPELEHISFLGNRVSDAGLEKLKRLPKLNSVQISPDDSLATKEGCKSLIDEILRRKSNVTR